MWDFLTSPFTSNLKLYLYLLVVAFTPFLANLIISRFINGAFNSYSTGVYVSNLLTDYTVEFYLFLLIYQFIKHYKKAIGLILKWVVIGLISILSILNLGCLFTLNTPFTGDHIYLIKDTHSQESTGFFDQYFSATTWIECIAVILIIILLFFIIHRHEVHHKFTNAYKIIAFSIVIVCTLGLFVLNGIMTEGTSILSSRAFIQFSQWKYICSATFGKEQKLLNPTPNLDLTDASLPDNIIILMGESASRTNMSVYGYDKSTTPYFDSLSKDSLIVLLKNVESPASSTNGSFSHMMTVDSATALSNDNGEYYKYETLPSIAKALGYKTTWISDHVRHNQYSNTVTNFADLCDSVRFIPGHLFDSCLITAVKDYISDNDSAQLIFIHLMGSHPQYTLRYPSTFSKFDPTEYPNLQNDRQRRLMAEYDNTIAYTDSILSEIIPLFDDKKALILYFSDHGQDLFQSSNNYCGHGQISNIASYNAATKIPLIFYVTPSYREEFSKQWERIKHATDKPVNTTDLIATLLDILNVDFTDKPGFIERNSMLSESYIMK